MTNRPPLLGAFLVLLIGTLSLPVAGSLLLIVSRNRDAPGWFAGLTFADVILWPAGSALALSVAYGLLVLMWFLLRERKLRAVPAAHPLVAGFPAEWDALLRREYPFYRNLGSRERREMQLLILQFLRKNVFIGNRGLDITDEHRVIVAAAAVRPIRKIGLRWYRRVKRIVIYPGPLARSGKTTVLGTASSDGVIELAWNAVLDGIRNPGDGHCVVAHEFAHAIDAATGRMDGLPGTAGKGAYADWARLIYERFARVRRSNDAWTRQLHERSPVVDPAELFAVLSEIYFERPDLLELHEPDLYPLFRRFYDRAAE